MNHRLVRRLGYKTSLVHREIWVQYQAVSGSIYLSTDITPYIKQLKRRLFEKENQKVFLQVFSQNEGFFQRHEKRDKRVERESRGWTGFSIYAFDGIPWSSASMNRLITKY